MKCRSISQVLGLLIVTAIVVGASLFVSWVLLGTVSLFRQSTSLSVVGGEAYIDPTDPFTAFGEVLVSIIGPDRVTIHSISVIYDGREYAAACLNCGSVVSNSYPNSANDIVSLKFYFTANTPVVAGSKLTIRVEYTVAGKTKYSVGSIYITG